VSSVASDRDFLHCIDRLERGKLEHFHRISVSSFYLDNRVNLVNLGVWMSRAVLAHKRDAGTHATQAWNMKTLPDEFSHSPAPHRLFVAAGGQWRGFFVLQPWVDHNPRDTTCPWTLVFDANTWAAVPPQPAPPRDRILGYTLDVPGLASVQQQGTK
jgi:hypothetical protein